MVLENVVEELRQKLANSEHRAEGLLHALQQKQGAFFVDSSLNILSPFYPVDVNNLETTIQQLRIQLSDSEQIAKQFSSELANSQLAIHAHRQKHQCEMLYADGRVVDAARSLLSITRSINDDVKSDVIIMDWLFGMFGRHFSENDAQSLLSGFTNKCVAALERIGDEASRAERGDDALAAYATALSLNPLNPNTCLDGWVSTMLLHRSTNEILEGIREVSLRGTIIISADPLLQLKLPNPAIYRAICDILEGKGRVMEAIGCFQQMRRELTQATDVGNERLQWDLGE